MRHNLGISARGSRMESVALVADMGELSTSMMEGCSPVPYVDTCSVAMIFLYVF